MSFEAIYDSPLGRLRLTSETGESLDSLTVAVSDSVRQDIAPVFMSAFRWLDRYFAGENPGEVPAVSPHGSDFSRMVWRELLKVPYGHTVTYGTLAERVGCRSARAVGAAVGRNPLLIIVPCHRVVASGELGGFSAGLDIKKALLEIESRSR